MFGLFRYDPPRTVVLDEKTGRYYVRRPAKYASPENPYEYYDRYDGRWEPAKSLVMDSFDTAEQARGYVQRHIPADRGENDKVCA